MNPYFERLSEVNRLELLGCRMTAAARLEQLERDFPQHFAGAPVLSASLRGGADRNLAPANKPLGTLNEGKSMRPSSATA